MYEDSGKLKLEITDGSADLYSVALELTDSTAPAVERNMTFKTQEANWRKSGTKYTGNNRSTFGLASYGSEHYADYTFSTDITRTSGADCGVMVRLKYATVTADLVHGIGGGSQGNPNYHYGYYVQMTGSQLVLEKRMFDRTVLASKSMSFKNNTAYNLKVTCRGNNIKVYVNDELCIDYTDNKQPILTGQVGLRNNRSVTVYDNIILTHENRGKAQQERRKNNEYYYALLKGKVQTGDKVVKIGKSYRAVKNGRVVYRKKAALVKIGKKTFAVSKKGVVKIKKLVKIGKKQYVNKSSKSGVYKKAAFRLKGKAYKANKKGVVLRRR